MEIETRGGAPAEFRADGDVVRVSGYAAVFNEEADIGGMFREVIKPGAFRNALNRGDDVVFLINHDGLPLARTTAGNLTLSEDDHGLRINAEMDPTDPDVVRLLSKMRNKMLDQMSFAFRVSDEGQRWDGDLRMISDVSLSDVSVVNFGAYSGTEIALRSRDDSAKERKERAERNAIQAQARIAARKAESEQKFRGIK